MFTGLWQMVHEPTGHIMTVKILDVSSTNKREMLLNALNGFVMLKLDCPHIITIYGVMAKKVTVWICMEPMRASVLQLSRTVHSAIPGGRMPEEVVRETAITVLHALNNLQNLNISHERVWPDNILVDDKANFKFCFVPATLDHEPHAIRGRTEIYYLGLTLIWLATGRFQTTLPADGPYSAEFRDFVAQCECLRRRSCAFLLVSIKRTTSVTVHFHCKVAV